MRRVKQLTVFEDKRSDKRPAITRFRFKYLVLIQNDPLKRKWWIIA